MKTNAMEVRTVPAAEFRFVDAADGKPPRIEGYAAVFNSQSEDLGGFREIVLPGAFQRTLKEGADVRLLINHDGLPLARTASRTLTLAEDAKGLRFSADLDPTDPDVMRLAPKMKRGDVTQCSFAFVTRADNWRTEAGQEMRELADVDLSDVSVVTYPAYPETSVAMRSLTRQKVARRLATGPGTEKRAVVEVDDDSLVYCSRWALQAARELFDSLNRVLDMAGTVDQSTLDDDDLEACEDLVSQLVDTIAKARRTKATLEAMGAEDETEDDADDDQPQEPDAEPMDANAAALALAAVE